MGLRGKPDSDLIDEKLRLHTMKMRASKPISVLFFAITLTLPLLYTKIIVAWLINRRARRKALPRLRHESMVTSTPHYR